VSIVIEELKNQAFQTPMSFETSAGGLDAFVTRNLGSAFEFIESRALAPLIGQGIWLSRVVCVMSPKVLVCICVDDPIGAF